MQPPGNREADLTVAELRCQVGKLEKAKGFDVAVEQRLAYLMSEVGEAASEVLALSREGAGTLGRWTQRRVRP